MRPYIRDGFPIEASLVTRLIRLALCVSTLVVPTAARAQVDSALARYINAIRAIDNGLGARPVRVRVGPEGLRAQHDGDRDPEDRVQDRDGEQGRPSGPPLHVCLQAALERRQPLGSTTIVTSGDIPENTLMATL